MIYAYIIHTWLANLLNKWEKTECPDFRDAYLKFGILGVKKLTKNSSFLHLRSSFEYNPNMKPHTKMTQQLIRALMYWWMNFFVSI